MSDNLFQHFRKEEHTFIEQVLEWKNQVGSWNAQKLTDFLDPREQHIVNHVTSETDDVRIAYFGGHEHAERKRAMLYPHFYSPQEADEQLALFEIAYPSKFVTLAHKHVLGSLMSLGLKRGKFGDIFMHGEQIQMVVAAEVSDYVQVNLTKIGQAQIKLIPITKQDIVATEAAWNTQPGTVASLRLDAVLAEAYHVSRQKIVTYIKSGQVKVNWKLIDSPDFECKVDDVISTRGLGRCKIMAIEGKTKKDKWRILTGLQK